MPRHAGWEPNAEVVRARDALARRLLEVRIALYGDRGGPELARRLGVPGRTWYNWEADVAIPGWALARLIVYCNLSPTWLLTGRGLMFAVDPSPDADPNRHNAALQRILEICQAEIRGTAADARIALERREEVA